MLFVVFLGGAPAGAFAIRPRVARHPRELGAHAGDRRADSRAHIRKVYTIAAAIAGIAGALLTQTTQTVALGSISFQRSADVLVMLVLGGAGRLYGGIIGAVDLHDRARSVLRHRSRNTGISGSVSCWSAS